MTQRFRSPLHEKVWRIVESQTRACIKDHPDWFALGATKTLCASIAKRCAGQVVAELQRDALVVHHLAVTDLPHREALHAALQDAVRRETETLCAAAREAAQVGAHSIIRRAPGNCGCQVGLCVSAIWFPQRRCWLCPLCRAERPYDHPKED